MMSFEELADTFSTTVSDEEFKRKMKILITSYVKARQLSNPKFTVKDLPMKYRKLLTDK